ncbi:lichenicidin A2 family type 2 lantibiotic [Exiguobacterium sp. TBG-PICH-001]|uniref:lichenicidin A2 family type 2 lantibiotic n=1 Tax=Exiguobacterium abrahamii TaxID=2785532 RepID=UPI0018A774DD|nr:lichenicidin A2 family type 2 lantibiotic [Exiguobacterium sp. TBG-PICH-001]MBF8153188.1 lichenicidin A2 family type 2 lantibiotic [Exiguobacterium sp. TBG-PICH-001]
MENLKSLDAVGTSLKELSEEEMNEIFGGSTDVDVRSSMVCSALLTFVGSYLASAGLKCGKDNKK